MHRNFETTIKNAIQLFSISHASYKLNFYFSKKLTSSSFYLINIINLLLFLGKFCTICFYITHDTNTNQKSIPPHTYTYPMRMHCDNILQCASIYYYINISHIHIYIYMHACISSSMNDIFFFGHAFLFGMKKNTHKIFGAHHPEFGQPAQFAGSSMGEPRTVAAQVSKNRSFVRLSVYFLWIRNGLKMLNHSLFIHKRSYFTHTHVRSRKLFAPITKPTSTTPPKKIKKKPSPSSHASLTRQLQVLSWTVAWQSRIFTSRNRTRYVFVPGGRNFPRFFFLFLLCPCSLRFNFLVCRFFSCAR